MCTCNKYCIAEATQARKLRICMTTLESSERAEVEIAEVYIYLFYYRVGYIVAIIDEVYLG